MIRMPPNSFRGPLPPLMEEQRSLEQELHSYVQDLPGTIVAFHTLHFGIDRHPTGRLS